MQLSNRTATPAPRSQLQDRHTEVAGERIRPPRSVAHPDLTALSLVAGRNPNAVVVSLLDHTPTAVAARVVDPTVVRSVVLQVKITGHQNLLATGHIAAVPVAVAAVTATEPNTHRSRVEDPTNVPSHSPRAIATHVAHLCASRSTGRSHSTLGGVRGLASLNAASALSPLHATRVRSPMDAACVLSALPAANVLGSARRTSSRPSGLTALRLLPSGSRCAGLTRAVSSLRGCRDSKPEESCYNQ